jgi:hypothetical protein
MILEIGTENLCFDLRMSPVTVLYWLLPIYGGALNLLCVRTDSIPVRW